jgi:hypothetical protein
MLHESGLGQGPLAARRGRGGPMASANIGNIRASRRRGRGGDGAGGGARVEI